MILYIYLLYLFTYSEKASAKAREQSCTHRKPDVPTRSDVPVMGLHSNKDFVKTNVMETTMAEPRKPQPTYADTKRGHRQLLENSGLVPKYIKKKVEEGEAQRSRYGLRGRPAGRGKGLDETFSS